MSEETLYTMSAPKLKYHARMSREKRAAQFMPFSALTGYEEELQEERRRTERFIELDAYEKEEVNRTLTSMVEAIDKEPFARIVYFVPDARKKGGSYTTVEGRLLKYRLHERTLLLDDGTEVPTDAICSIEEIKCE